MNVGQAHSECNPNSSWLSDRGGWAAYTAGVMVLHLLLRVVLCTPWQFVWTATNVIHNLLMYVIMHMVKGAPWLNMDQGESRRLTYWEQIDSGAQFTDTKKFLTIFPIGLFLITNHATNYSLVHFLINLVSLIFVLVPKMPQFHKGPSDVRTMRAALVSQQLKYETMKRRSSRQQELARVGEVIRDRWEVVEAIGNGGFGQVYRAVDKKRNMNVAIKMESKQSKKPCLKMEVLVIQAFEASRHCPRFYGSGEWNNALYMVMQLLGPSIGQRRRQMAEKKFSLSTSLRATVQMIDAIQEFHDCGFVHRDIKLSNMALSCNLENRNIVILLDFGLARRYVDTEGYMRPERDEIGFRGTLRYASLTAHQMQDLGRRDDLWSLFYVCTEMIVGNLPWGKVRDRSEVRHLKEQHCPELLCGQLPFEFRLFVNHLNKLSFADRPDYALLISSMHNAMLRLNVAINDPYDWESMPNSQ
uniref:Protein kinase domain-containing protein n=1 Tax=Trichuris muris TaxID=70415 RepID=A0A5S6QNE8_TRIMR